MFFANDVVDMLMYAKDKGKLSTRKDEHGKMSTESKHGNDEHEKNEHRKVKHEKKKKIMNRHKLIYVN